MLVPILHLVATTYMVGVIWFVQLVHYPGFADVGPAGFPRYANRHVSRTFWVVGPPMLVEAGLAIVLIVTQPSTLAFVGAALLLTVWGATALFQIPAHGALQKQWDADTVRRLVTTNWIRTVAWTARGLVATGLVLKAAA